MITLKPHAAGGGFGEVLSMPLVSIVLTTKNESRNIVTCLESVRRQTFSDYEIIVVDNASTDDTKDLARRSTAKVFDLGPERSAQ